MAQKLDLKSEGSGNKALKNLALHGVSKMKSPRSSLTFSPSMRRGLDAGVRKK